MSALISRRGLTQAWLKVTALGLSLVLTGCLPEGRTSEQLLSEANDAGGAGGGACSGWTSSLDTTKLVFCLGTCVSKGLQPAGYSACVNACLEGASDDEACRSCWGKHLNDACPNVEVDCSKACAKVSEQPAVCSMCFKNKCGEPDCL